jgi:hypothetical protein
MRAATCCAQLSGDIRLSPFYDALKVVETVEGYVKDINEHVTDLPTRGPASKYVLEGDDVDIKRGVLEFTWVRKVSQNVWDTSTQLHRTLAVQQRRRCHCPAT